MIDSSFLETFITIVHEGSFRAAAKKLHKTQPVLTYQIQQLEQYLGIILFDRNNYRATLTKEGHYFLPKAEKTFHSISELSQYKETIKQGIESHLSISLSSLYPVSEFSTQLKKIQRLYPDTTVLVSIDTLSGTEKVKQKQVDFAITEPEDIDTDLYYESCMDIDMILVCSKNHILTQLSSFSLHDLMPFPQITLKSSSVNPVKDRGIFHPTKKWVVSDISTKKLFIQNGFGWGYLPLHYVKTELETNQLHEIKLNGILNPKVQLCKIKLASHPLQKVATLLWNSL